MATGSLTTRWSYPEAEVVKHDLQQSRCSKEETKVESSTVVDDASASKKKKVPKPSRREQLLRQPSKPLKVDRSEHQHLDRSGWVPDFTDPSTVRPDEQEDHNLSKCQVELLNKLYKMQYRRSLDSWFVDGGYLSKPLNEA